MDNRDRGFTLYKKGYKYKEIAEELGVPESTVKSWATRYWKKEKVATKKDATKKKKVSQKVATEDATNKPKNKGGAPKGNVNAVGNKGGPGAPLGNVNALKHGGYSKIFWDTLSEEEQELIETMDKSVEQQLLDEISLLTVRERRIMHNLKKYRELADGKTGQVITSVVRSEDKREFSGEEEKLLYDQRIQAKIDAEERLPGRAYRMTTTTEAAIDIVHRLEDALSRCQDQKRRCLETLHKIRQTGTGSSGEKPENNLLEALTGYALEDFDISDIPELQQTPESGDDVVD